MDEDDLIDELDELTEDELADLLAVEEAELVALEEAEAERSDVEFGDVGDGAQLNLWQEEVENFGGRYGSPTARGDVKKQLSQGQLGQRIVLPTSRPLGEVFPNSVLLAEVNLQETMDFDVAFSYDNLFPPPGTTNQSIFQGDGFVRVTWGSPGTFQHLAEIDGAYGWRHSFAASFLRVEYIPIDPRGSKPLKSGQVRDLGVGAIITPAKGTTNTELTKSFTLRDMTSPDAVFGAIPRWAQTVSVLGDFENEDSEWTLILLAQDNGVGRALSEVHSNADSGEWPTGASRRANFKVPQGATLFFLITNGAAGMGAVENPSLIFGLSL